MRSLHPWLTPSTVGITVFLGTTLGNPQCSLATQLGFTATVTNGYTYSPATGRTSLNGLAVTGTAEYDPSAPISVNQGFAAYYNMQPAIKLTFNLNGQSYETVGSLSGYSYVYLNTAANRFLLETLGSTSDGNKQIYSYLDLYASSQGQILPNGISLSAARPTSPFVSNGNFFYSSLLAGASDYEVYLQGVQTVSNVQAIPTPSVLLGVLFTSALSYTRRKQACHE